MLRGAGGEWPRLVLVTGSASGIGAATAIRFAAHGAKLILLDRDEAGLERTCTAVRHAGGEAAPYALDLADADAVAGTAVQIKRDVGVPDAILNFAGGGMWRFAEETEPHEAAAMVSVPYLAAFHLTRAFLPELLARDSGVIVTMTSFAAMVPFSGATGYIASRKAMIGLHEALTADLFGTNVRTALAYFAKVESPFWAHNPGSEERLPYFQKFIPVVTSAEAARAIVAGIVSGKRELFAPSRLKTVLLLNRLFPSATRFLMNRAGYARPCPRSRPISS
jgi:short-subunit dehydrogenase